MIAKRNLILKTRNERMCWTFLKSSGWIAMNCEYRCFIEVEGAMRGYRISAFTEKITIGNAGSGVCKWIDRAFSDIDKILIKFDVGQYEIYRMILKIVCLANSLLRQNYFTIFCNLIREETFINQQSASVYPPQFSMKKKKLFILDIQIFTEITKHRIRVLEICITSSIVCNRRKIFNNFSQFNWLVGKYLPRFLTFWNNFLQAFIKHYNLQLLLQVSCKYLNGTIFAVISHFPSLGFFFLWKLWTTTKQNSWEWFEWKQETLLYWLSN